jgi:hypothetical protein
MEKAESYGFQQPSEVSFLLHRPINLSAAALALRTGDVLQEAQMYARQMGQYCTRFALKSLSTRVHTSHGPM